VRSDLPYFCISLKFCDLGHSIKSRDVYTLNRISENFSASSSYTR
jgi:hypothetical protein